jgi:heme-degrading monooxygenase HmoA
LWWKDIPPIVGAGERRLVAVYARISTFEGSPEHIDEGLRQVREDVLPQLQQQEGFEGLVALTDRQSGKTLGITFWESEEALKASEEAAERLREDSAQAMSDTIAGVERYEVGLFEVASAGPVSGVTDTVGGVTDTVGGATQPVSGVTDTVSGATDNLLGGGEKKS